MQLRSRTLPPPPSPTLRSGVPSISEPSRKKRKFEPEPEPEPEPETNIDALVNALVNALDALDDGGDVPVQVASPDPRSVPVPIPIPTQKHDRDRILVFDTETTGLLPTKNHQTRTYPPVESYPHILQLCFVVYHVPTQTVEETYNEYIRVDDAVTISPVITDITGITRELCCTRGVAVADALAAFYRAYQRCGVLVAHNIRFDKEVLMAEMEREHDAMVARGCDVPTTLFHYL